MSIVRYGVVAVAVLSCGGLRPNAAAAKPGHDTNIRSADASETRRAEHSQHVEVIRLDREYRHRLARLDHLRELVEQQDDPDRLAELDALYARLREHRNEARELCETRHDHRPANHAERSERGRARQQYAAERRETRHSRRQIRRTARDRAEQRWIEARREISVKVPAATHINHAAGRLAQKRWREEARDYSAQRWERAARRSGMLDDVRWSSVSSRPGRGVGGVGAEDVDREFSRLWREIGGGESSRAVEQ